MYPFSNSTSSSLHSANDYTNADSLHTDNMYSEYANNTLNYNNVLGGFSYGNLGNMFGGSYGFTGNLNVVDTQALNNDYHVSLNNTFNVGPVALVFGHNVNTNFNADQYLMFHV